MESSHTCIDAEPLLEKLLAVLRPRERVLTAFSGGVDSTLVAVAARRALGRADAPAAIGDSPSLPRNELADARVLARRLDLELIEVQPGEQLDEQYRQNDAVRCYYCKGHLYAALHGLAARLDIAFLANGTNTDDLSDHRPGLDAAREARVISPLVEAGLDKAGVRAVAHQLGLENSDKPAAACLASRLPYGTAVTEDRLAQVERAEDALRRLGFSGFRVRHHDQVARIELPWDQVRRLTSEPTRGRVIRQLREAGYLYVTLDLEGFRSGSGNLVLTVGGVGVTGGDKVRG